VFVRKYPLPWKVIINWALYPLIYLIYSLLRGAISGLYPYNFIDAKQIGYGQTAINSLFVLIAFLVVSVIFIGISRLSKKIIITPYF
ncbi:MAG TPA: Pr6Pr family membrane protein, partial [Mucilaginibacter sp.]